MSEHKPEIVILRESLWQSIVSDALTFGMLLALPWLNYRFCGGSTFINAAIAFAWLTMVLARASGQRAKFTKTPEQAKKWLAEQYPD